MANFDQLIQELNFKAVRSSGAGGQHVNKTSSKIIVFFDIENSMAFSDEEKARVLRRLSARISTSGDLILESQATRSQHRNKEDAISRLVEIIKEALKKPKPRKKTKPTKASKLKRLRAKKIRSDKKNNRQKPSL